MEMSAPGFLPQRGPILAQQEDPPLEEITRALLEPAKEGEAKAQFMLGAAYAQGFGITKSLTSALLWRRRAAEQGLARAQFSLGNMYALGEGTAKNYKKAASWFRKAADQDHAEAQFQLADALPDNGARFSGPARGTGVSIGCGLVIDQVGNRLARVSESRSTI